jgi:putative endonuclease
MSFYARWIYRGLLWKEKQRARAAGGLPPGGGGKAENSHLETGRRGEALAYWHLRQAGYRVVARNRRLGGSAGELDLIAWDGRILAFAEVKTRTSAAAGPPEAALKREQQRRIIRGAHKYMRQHLKAQPSYRFDVISVFWTRENGFQVRLIKDAYKDRA